MATIDLRQSVLDYITNKADNKFLRLVNALAKTYQEDEQEITLSEEQYQIIDKRREAHLNDESKSFTWEQVKQNARNAS